MFDRKEYLEALLRYEKDPRIKVVAGLKRSGKTYLLKRIFKDYLLRNGVDANHFIYVSLEDEETTLSLSAGKFIGNLKARIKDRKRYYLILNGIQNPRLIENSILKVANQENWILHIAKKMNGISNLSIYVVESNRKSFNEFNDCFNGNVKEIHLSPISFKEYVNATSPDDMNVALERYVKFGGLPLTVNLSRDEYKEEYLKNLISLTYYRDIKDKEKIRSRDYFDILLNILSNNIGVPLNQNKIAEIFHEKYKKRISKDTVSQYLSFLENSHLIEKVGKLDTKTNKEISGSYKYYFKDNGILNSLRSFDMSNKRPLIENAIYNELARKKCVICWGNLETYRNDESGKTTRLNAEIDFVAKIKDEHYLIQLIPNSCSKDEMQKSIKPLLKLPNYYKKIVVTESKNKLMVDENNISYLSLSEFLMTDFYS